MTIPPAKLQLRLSALALSAVASFATSAIEMNNLELQFNLLPSEDNRDCEILQTPTLDLGDISSTGVFTIESLLEVQCGNPEQKFRLMADSLSDGDYIYSDEYVDAYMGTPTQYTSENTVFISNYSDATHSACTLAGATSINVGGYELYPIGGKSSNLSDNRNGCMYVRNTSADGNYAVEMKGVIDVKSLPSSDDSTQSTIVVPFTFIAYE